MVSFGEYDGMVPRKVLVGECMQEVQKCFLILLFFQPWLEMVEYFGGCGIFSFSQNHMTTDEVMLLTSCLITELLLDCCLDHGGDAAKC